MCSQKMCSLGWVSWMSAGQADLLAPLPCLTGGAEGCTVLHSHVVPAIGKRQRAEMELNRVAFISCKAEAAHASACFGAEWVAPGVSGELARRRNVFTSALRCHGAHGAGLYTLESASRRARCRLGVFLNGLGRRTLLTKILRLKLEFLQGRDTQQSTGIRFRRCGSGSGGIEWVIGVCGRRISGGGSIGW